MALHAYLESSLNEHITMGGVGDFGESRAAVFVSDSIGYQYDQEPATSDGWVVAWVEE